MRRRLSRRVLRVLTGAALFAAVDRALHRRRFSLAHLTLALFLAGTAMWLRSLPPPAPASPSIPTTDASPPESP